MNIYAIKDIEAGVYDTPFFQPTDVHALRAFRTEVNRANEQNLIYLYPGEYDLVQLGTYNRETGEITPAIKKLTNGAALKQPKS